MVIAFTDKRISTLVYFWSLLKSPLDLDVLTRGDELSRPEASPLTSIETLEKT
jgi:hypothetical protein